MFLILLLHLELRAQDTIPRPGVFDEGYFFIGTGDVLKFKSYVQFDGYFPSHSSPGFSEFLIRRARFAATGFFHQQFRYMLYGRYDKGKVELNEAFIEARHLSFARLRAGQFKVPFSLSNLKSSSQLDLVSRSFIVEIFLQIMILVSWYLGKTRQNILIMHLVFLTGPGSINGKVITAKHL
ncbi:porin [Chitinophaga sp. MD30]|uniref:porin n=1 Tax=Chitinophaga sp. MD30 TaxID=2033437 RepID=UPI0012FDA73F|nr:porin [Chitinophaga sp. MD30]